MQLLTIMIDHWITLSNNFLSYWCLPAGTVNKAGDTPLSLACANGHLEVIKYLIITHGCTTNGDYLYNIVAIQYLCCLYCIREPQNSNTQLTYFIHTIIIACITLNLKPALIS